MLQVETRRRLRQLLDEDRAVGRSVGLVPTMGALHAGHASLIERAVQECDVVVVSDFVNPTQFNDPNDLRSYPRDLQSDIQLVASIGADYLFVPSVEEMYPEPDTRQFDLAPLDSVMEGAKRPGHFNGVAQIVSRLIELVSPDRSYFGEKDYQQLLIVRHMVRQLGLPGEVVGCPIVREADGLAMSSRNQLLSPECREIASLIHATLAKGREVIVNEGVDACHNYVVNGINASALLEVEYFSLADAETLSPVMEYTPGVMGFIAVRAGRVRLIDNITY